MDPNTPNQPGNPSSSDPNQPNPPQEPQTPAQTPIDTPPIDTPSATEQLAQPVTPPPSQNGNGLPKAGHKKAIAVSAAGISAMLIIIGVFAMSDKKFSTNTEQDAAMKAEKTVAPTKVVSPTPSPTPSDPIEQAIMKADEDLKKVDEDTSSAQSTVKETDAGLSE